VGDQRQPELLLEGAKALREQLRVSRVAVDATLAIVPTGARTLGIPPAVQLQIAERDALLVEALLDGQQRAGIAQRRLEVVVVGSAVVGPVAEPLERHVCVVGWPRLAV
jgi:hypothetical protein